MNTVRIDSVRTGVAEPFGPNGEMSAIRKRPVEGAVTLGPLGLDGDEHAYHGHGGADKALLHYASEHYQAWRREYSGFTLEPGAFGENIVTGGITEDDVCVGDRLRIGSEVLVEVSQPRQPCWKLGYQARIAELPSRMQERAAPGWYYRVIETGRIAAGDALEVVERPYPDWSLGRLVTGFYGTPLDRAFLKEIVALPELGAEWRIAARNRLSTDRIEDWNRRLYG